MMLMIGVPIIVRHVDPPLYRDFNTLLNVNTAITFLVARIDGWDRTDTGVGGSGGFDRFV